MREGTCMTICGFDVVFCVSEVACLRAHSDMKLFETFCLPRLDTLVPTINIHLASTWQALVTARSDC